ncbi:glutamine amidotransferase [Pseudonocardia sp. RS11V-5]|uniref:type 1 glutamine amidotransferase n=1 Tax=Pseudonocardia terrae TaxID=2905831 RepID=UPI001E3DD6C0|nr:glutamine amidotransferase [Pseudonocardia terrae]MCE3554712.1 glutamine amidotransferase [Pseudonocardia terrae]
MPRPSDVRIAVLLPDLLSTYGDRGNDRVLAQRLRWRGFGVETVLVEVGPVPAECDLYVLGGGEDAAQLIATQRLRASTGLHRAADRGAPVLAVCAGLQILGESFSTADGTPEPGLGLLDIRTTLRARRAVGEIVTRTVLPELEGLALTGFENHAGATHLGQGVRPLGTVVQGVGNGAGAPTEGAVSGRILGSYLHGPLLARNPQVADLLLTWATGEALTPLAMPEVEVLRAERLRAHRRATR